MFCCLLVNVFCRTRASAAACKHLLHLLRCSSHVSGVAQEAAAGVEKFAIAVGMGVGVPMALGTVVNGGTGTASRDGTCQAASTG